MRGRRVGVKKEVEKLYISKGLFGCVGLEKGNYFVEIFLEEENGPKNK